VIEEPHRRDPGPIGMSIKGRKKKIINTCRGMNCGLWFM